MSRATTSVEYLFTNIYGEKWIFHFDPKTKVAFVKGSDVDWESYPVIEGAAYGLVMSSEERTWLSDAWEKVCSNVGALGLYQGKPTKLVIGKNYCFLKNDYCPICLLQKKEFEVHHCIWASDGGPDTPSNLLAVCNTCHAIITRGSVEDRFPRNQAAFQHQVMYFGVRLFQDAVGSRNSRGAIPFAEQHPTLAKHVQGISQATSEQLSMADQKLKAESRIAYQYFRDLAHGKWSWSDYERLFSPKDKQRQDK